MEKVESEGSDTDTTDNDDQLVASRKQVKGLHYLSLMQWVQQK